MAGRQSIPTIPALFSAIMPEIKEIGKACGYAICIHGSMSHDLDLVAVPWVYNAVAAEVLVERIRQYVNGYIDLGGSQAMAPSPEQKSHGRMGWAIYLNSRFTGAYIDISVMPRIDPKSKTIIATEVKA